MDSTSVSTLGASASTTGSAATATSATIDSDFETFLKMLTAQMENQDPLNPIDSEDFAVQIATFSGVEQQVRSNDLLESINAALGASGLSAYAGWVGQEVRATAPAAFDGTPVTVVPEIADAADSAVLVVRNAAGAEVQRLDIPSDGAPMEWAGVDDTGTALPDGLYRFTVESLDAEGLRIAEADAAIYAEVQEAVVGTGGVNLRLAGDTEIAATTVTALRAAGV